jgi:predicted ABC-type ATPase
MDKKVILFAGPNGAGKTTFAREFLPNEAHCVTFLNADLIAAGLSPFAPARVEFKAARLMRQAMAEAARAGESFAFETTLSGRAYAHAIPRWRALGYRVKLVFLQLPAPEAAMARVAERVRQGGHDVPEATIRRRFAAGRANLSQLYKPLVNAWIHFDNSGMAPRLLDWSER